MVVENDRNTYHLKPTALMIDPPKAGPAQGTPSNKCKEREKTAKGKFRWA